VEIGMEFGILRQEYYYNPKLDSDYNLGKDLSKRGENNQLVKHKDTGLYLQLYISKDNEKGKKFFKKIITKK